MRIENSLVRSGLLCGLALGACLIASKPALAEITLTEKNGWTFFTDGRVNVFASQGTGDGFPAPTAGPNGAPAQHLVVGSGQPFTAGYESLQNDAGGKYNSMRVRSGFLASILALGVRRNVTETTTAKGYISLWGTAQSFARDRTQDTGNSVSKGYDMREGFVDFEGPWGGLVAGRQLGLFGSMSAQIDFNYGHNYGLGLPCVDDFYASCGHIGTGALGPGFAAGFVYTTPPIRGLKLVAGLFDPVRLLGAWEHTPYPRPEGAVIFERRVSPSLMYKLQFEGMYQLMRVIQQDPTTGQLGNRDDRVWGVAGGARLEAGIFRLGLSAFRGKGLGAYVAIQNSSSSFNVRSLRLRYFTGLYAQTAVVLGRSQISLGVGQVRDDQLAEDKLDDATSGLKTQTGVSAAFYRNILDNLAVGIDVFYFKTDWWGAPTVTVDPTTMVATNTGMLTGEKQALTFVNVGATYHW